MKKYLSVVAALGLVAGVAATASAAVTTTVSGTFKVDGYYLNYGDYGTGDLQNAFWLSNVVILPTIEVNDKIALKADVRLLDDTVWGDYASYGDAFSEASVDGVYGGGIYSSALPPSSASSNPAKYGTGINLQKIYMEYMSPVGQWTVGRVAAGEWGPAFANNDVAADRVMWAPNFMPEPWNMLLFLEKGTEYDGIGQLTTGNISDQDSDYYEVDLGYKDAHNDVTMALGYNRNATVANVMTTWTKVNLWGFFRYDAFGLDAEFDSRFGENDADTGTDTDIQAFGFFANGWYQASDALTVGALYFYASGDDNPSDTDLDNYMGPAGLGDMFTPFYILNAPTTGIFNGDLNSINSAIQAAGTHTLAAYANYQASAPLCLHGAIGYSMADQEMAGWDSDYGWELDAGAAYQLLDNLTYEVHFAYTLVGDFFKMGSANANTEDIYLLSNHLTMTF